ncbi:hypothetical protein B0H14DRAFT_3127156 [Mycena olivaceomarginata]|nr:hypothetical protein B0H14DRAFT_3127156 [Mycena olivaceomarginata]
MTVIHDCLCGGVGGGLGDIEVCEMLETVLTTAVKCLSLVSLIALFISFESQQFQETLRRSAENTMHSLVHTVFSRLHSLDPTTEEEKLLSADERIPRILEIKSVAPRLQPPQLRDLNVFLNTDGLPSILELLRVLINVLDPNDQQHIDSTWLVALGILNAVFEASEPRIPEFPSLEALIVDTGCKFLFQLARSESNSVLHSALGTISIVFDTMRPHLKLQQELFLAFTTDRLVPPAPLPGKRGNGQLTASPRPGTPASATPVLGPPEKQQGSETGTATPSRVLVAPACGETRDLILETLTQISRHLSFMRFIEFLTKAVYPSHYPDGLDARQRNVQYLCLDLLAFVNDMAARADREFRDPESLIQAKSQKKLIVAAAARFNNKPKKGVAFLEENRLIYTDLPPDAPDSAKAHNLAVFLKGCALLDERLLGDYISREENLPLLKAFIGLFDFKDKAIADAMRDLLETFRLPGESQQIARITETFTSIYFTSEPDEIQNEDAVYVLAHSVIMLNTDLHKPQVRQNIYYSLRKREITMPEEHVGQLGFEYAWKDLLTPSRDAGTQLLSCNSSLFDVDMFKSVWKPVISAIAYAFISFDDDYIVQRSIAGFRQAGSQLPVVDVEGQSVTVSNLSTKFGTNFKGQLAAVVLFNIVNGNGNALREGWTLGRISAADAYQLQNSLPAPSTGDQAGSLLLGTCYPEMDVWEANKVGDQTRHKSGLGVQAAKLSAMTQENR